MGPASYFWVAFFEACGGFRSCRWLGVGGKVCYHGMTFGFRLLRVSSLESGRAKSIAPLNIKETRPLVSQRTTDNRRRSLTTISKNNSHHTSLPQSTLHHPRTMGPVCTYFFGLVKHFVTEITGQNSNAGAAAPSQRELVSNRRRAS